MSLVSKKDKLFWMWLLISLTSPKKTFLSWKYKYSNDSELFAHRISLVLSSHRIYLHK